MRRFFASAAIYLCMIAIACAQEGPVLRVDPNPQGFNIDPPRPTDPFNTNPGSQQDEIVDDGLADSPAQRITDPASLPDAVADMRARLLQAARTGDIRKLARLADPGEGGTQLTIFTGEASGDDDEPAGDALDYIEQAAQDPSSVEALAIMIDILETDPVLFAPGTSDATYVWPWFWARSPSGLTPPEVVELLQVVTWFDLEEMRINDSYTFYRLGIAPDGRWRFFISGD